MAAAAACATPLVSDNVADAAELPTLAAAFAARGGGGASSSSSSFTAAAYDALPAAEKADLVWSLVERTRGTTGPATLGVAMVTSGFATSHDFTMEHRGDELQPGRRKFIHQSGLVARCRFDTTGYGVDVDGDGVGDVSPFTGLFGPAGADHCLVRCSMARRTGVGPSAKITATPGIAIKAFRSGCHSGNVVAMYGVDGQHSWNFFRYPLRTAVEEATEFKTKLLGKAFAKAGTFPGRVGMSDFAARDQDGNPPPDGGEIGFPFVLEFHPPAELSARFGDEMDDAVLQHPDVVGAMAGHAHMKSELDTLRAGDTLFEVRAWTDPWIHARAAARTAAAAAAAAAGSGGAAEAADAQQQCPGEVAPVPLGRLVLTTPFVESAYADGRLFFKHQRYEEDFVLRPEWGCPAWYALGLQGATDANKLRAAQCALAMRERGPEDGLVGTHRYHLRAYPNTLVGREAVDWMLAQGIARDRDDAVLLGRLMVGAGALRHAHREHGFEDAGYFYTFDPVGHASVCPVKWRRPEGSVCPVAGGRGSPRHHAAHRHVQRHWAESEAAVAAAEAAEVAEAAAAAAAAAEVGGREGEAKEEGGAAEVPHLTVGSLHRTMGH